ncbi:MAG: hypothetical protein SNJ71_01765 [Bacteroidales bacterium]
MNSSYRNLEKVKKIIFDATGLDISYAYDDLVFSEHTAFILRFADDVTNRLECFFHKDCIVEERQNILNSLKTVAQENMCIVELKGIFDLEQKGEEVEIKFTNTL